MRILAQRVREASVTVEGQVIGRIGAGFLLLIGLGAEDAADSGAALAPMTEKLLNLRVFADAEEKMNRSILDARGEILAVSQFTLHADCRKGRRPSFTRAAQPDAARAMFEQLVALLRESGLRIETGKFGAMMQVALVNDGPVTIWLDSEELLK